MRGKIIKVIIFATIALFAISWCIYLLIKNLITYGKEIKKSSPSENAETDQQARNEAKG